MAIGKFLIVLSIAIFIVGIFFYLGGKFFPLEKLSNWKLPGDVFFKKGKYSIYFPIVTCIFISILLTIVLNLVFWFFKK